MTTDKELKLCPLCPPDKSDVYLIGHGMGHRSIKCNFCGLETARYANTETARRVWNTRTAPPTDGLRSAAQELRMYEIAEDCITEVRTADEGRSDRDLAKNIVDSVLWHYTNDVQQNAIASQAEKLRGMREENDKLQTAFGYFLNGMGYYTTFPDNAEDGEQLRKSATWNFLTAENLVQDHVKANCDQAMKSHAMGQPEHKAMVEKCWHKLKENK